LSIFNTPRHKVNLRSIVEAGLTVVFAFASIYYTLNSVDPGSFSRPLNILDSIYFSLITIATVGYGDISPVSAPAKILSMSQVLIGLLYVLFVIVIFLSVYIRNHEKSNSSENNTA